MKLENCEKCKELCKGREKVVPPSGDPKSPVAFVGEAPGEREAKQGKPFVGSAGRVLNQVLEEEGISRDEVLVTNTVKCRPPQNREPTDEEMEACFPFLEKELKNAKLIVALGRVAAKDLLGKEIKLGDELNKVQTIEIGGKKKDLVVAYHPAASFYNKKVKESLRETVRIAKGYLSSA